MEQPFLEIQIPRKVRWNLALHIRKLSLMLSWHGDPPRQTVIQDSLQVRSPPECLSALPQELGAEATTPCPKLGNEVRRRKESAECRERRGSSGYRVTTLPLGKSERCNVKDTPIATLSMESHDVAGCISKQEKK